MAFEHPPRDIPTRPAPRAPRRSPWRDTPWLLPSLVAIGICCFRLAEGVARLGS